MCGCPANHILHRTYRPSINARMFFGEALGPLSSASEDHIRASARIIRRQEFSPSERQRGRRNKFSSLVAQSNFARSLGPQSLYLKDAMPQKAMCVNGIHVICIHLYNIRSTLRKVKVSVFPLRGNATGGRRRASGGSAGGLRRRRFFLGPVALKKAPNQFFLTRNAPK
jgi:hypothetical protein